MMKNGIGKAPGERRSWAAAAAAEATDFSEELRRSRCSRFHSHQYELVSETESMLLLNIIKQLRHNVNCIPNQINADLSNKVTNSYILKMSQSDNVVAQYEFFEVRDIAV